MDQIALIFDMDGVLVDVSQSYRLAIKETAGFFSKKEITFERIQEIKNKGGHNNDWDLTEGILLSMGLKINKNLIISKFQELYLGRHFDGYIKNERWLLDREILRKLYNKNDLAIVTGRPKDEAEYTLKMAKVRELFKEVITMQDIPRYKQKPDPYGLKIALKKLNKTEAFYFGDTIDDMRMASEAGIKAIGVLPPGVNGKLKTLLIKNGAEAVLDNINKIEEVLK